MADEPTFLPVHHLVLNAATFVALKVYMVREDRLQPMLDALGRALAEAPRDSAMRARLCEIGEALHLASQGDRGGLNWAHARTQAAEALANVFYWRAGLADAATKGEDDAA